MKLFLIKFLLLFILLFPSIGIAAPVLNFSDITSGPKTGNTDGLGSGAIVTIWGNNLGSTKGTSKVYVGGVEATQVYYWEDADVTGSSGPAELYLYHKMQAIAFAIPATAPNGLTDIYVTVNGEQSNYLPFTVRTGNIYFVKTTGNNSNPGSWSSPWLTLSYAANNDVSPVIPGDIIYVTNGIQELSGLVLRNHVGTADNPISFIAYPGAQVIVQNSTHQGSAIGNYNAASKYINFSKLIIRTNGTGIDTHKGMRAIANEITNSLLGTQCADGSNGAISGENLNGRDTAGGYIKAFGNYIHNFGCETTSAWHHVFYISNRSGAPIEPFEYGWNFLIDNKAHGGLHIYDEGVSGGWSGTLKIHDNVVINQVSVGFGIKNMAYDGYPDFTMDVEVYNNLMVNVGLETTMCGNGHNVALTLGGFSNKSHVKIYNNVIYGYAIPGVGFALEVQGDGDAHRFGGTWEFINNIVVDLHDRPFEYPTHEDEPEIHSNNIWYNGGNGVPPAPAWATGESTANPDFVNPGAFNFTLNLTSPGLNTGSASVSSIVTSDIIGAARPQGAAYDIGVYEYPLGAMSTPGRTYRFFLTTDD